MVLAQLSSGVSSSFFDLDVSMQYKLDHLTFVAKIKVIDFTIEWRIINTNICLNYKSYLSILELLQKLYPLIRGDT